MLRFVIGIRLASGCSAVGSALRSGRRGRAFESPHPDQKQSATHWVSNGVADCVLGESFVVKALYRIRQKDQVAHYLQ